MTESLYEQAVDLYRAETKPMMRDHFFRVALNRLGHKQLASLIEALTDPSLDDLREVVS